MKILTKIAMTTISAIGIVLALPLTAIALIIDMVNSVRNERVTFDRTTDMWIAARDYVEHIYNDEI